MTRLTRANFAEVARREYRRLYQYALMRLGHHEAVGEGPMGDVGPLLPFLSGTPALLGCGVRLTSGGTE